MEVDINCGIDVVDNEEMILENHMFDNSSDDSIEYYPLSVIYYLQRIK